MIRTDLLTIKKCYDFESCYRRLLNESYEGYKKSHPSGPFLPSAVQAIN